VFQEAGNFWVPDIFIDGAKEIESPAYYQRPAYIRVYKDHVIRYSSRIHFEVSCNMDFHCYPNDKQACNIKFESFGHTTQYLRFNWHKTDSYISPVLSLKQFKMNADFAPPYITNTYDLQYPG
jgi:hypothetical protein